MIASTRTTWLVFGLMLTAGAAFADTEVRGSGGGSKSAAGASCSISGTAPVGHGVKLYEKASGSTTLGQFTGAATALKLLHAPKSSSDRAKVATGTSSGGFRIEGYIDATELPLVTTSQIPVFTGHTYIATQRTVKFAGSSPGKLTVKKKLHWPFNQTFKGTALCSSFSFSQGTAKAWTTPGEARGYSLTRSELDLYEAPKGSADKVATLYNGTSDGVLFWSTKRRGGWVYVEYHGDVDVEGWAKARFLRRLPKGETMDTVATVTKRSSKTNLKVQGKYKVVTAPNEVDLHIAAKPTAHVFGTIAKGTKVIVTDVVADMASVLPKDLHVMPETGEQWWAKAKDLGL